MVVDDRGGYGGEGGDRDSGGDDGAHTCQGCVEHNAAKTCAICVENILNIAPS